MSTPHPRAAEDYLVAGSGRPAVRQPHLLRARLHARLDASVRQPVTVIRAGPGWGKTTLAAAWAQDRRDVAWLTLRPRHTAVSAFRAGIAAALRTTGRHRGARPRVLVLDDLQVLDGSPSMIVLADLIARSPAQLILLSRTVPALPPDTGRPGIGAADLAFDDTEAAALAALYQGRGDTTAQSEGWPLGLRLALDACGPDATDDYLWREVVAPQPSRVRRFLLRTSIAGEICPALAEQLTGLTDAHCVLHELERSTGFVTVRDGEHQWFRYHPQLRSALRRRLEREFPDDVGRLHARAARWHAAERAVPEALQHAAEAADWVHLGRLVAELAVTRIVSTDRRSLVEVVQRIPPELLPTTPELSLCAALIMFFAGDFTAIPVWLERARAMLRDRPPADRLVVGVALDVLEVGTVHRVRGDMPGLLEATTRVLDRMRDASTDELPLLHQLRAVAVNNKGVGLLWTGRLDQAERYLGAALRSARSTGVQLVELNALGHLALLAALRGDLGRAGEQGRAARELAESLDLGATVQAAAGYLALALAEAARDEVAEAQEALRAVLHVEANPPEAALAVVTAAVRVQLLRAGGDPGAAATLLRQVRLEMPSTLDASYLRDWLDRIEATLTEPAPSRPDRTPVAALAEPLSEREIQVLGFLPSVLTAQEIADELGVSVNTVRAHQRAIYRKLGAGRRREAVDIAHRLGHL